MNDEGYCYDNQFSSLEGWLCKISEQLDDIIRILEPSDEPIGMTHSGELVYKIDSKNRYKIAKSRLCDDCIKELTTPKTGAGRTYDLCKNCSMLDATNFLDHVNRINKGTGTIEARYDSGTSSAVRR